ncbi:MAG TPA: branched-chain amino acid aminotransferase [Gammaproteobacteria bacterium]|nr:branched-chain amino acid aminotransferase [Gammaproteobacteria bacterium]
MSDFSFCSIANVNGSISPLEEATIPIMDRGFLYGDSVYEVFRTYEGVPFLLKEHFDRLENSAKLIGMRLGQSRQQLLGEIQRTIQASGVIKGQEVYVRYQITRGEGTVDLFPGQELITRFVIIVKPLPVWNPEFYRVGMTLAIPETRRNPVNCLDPNIKGGNYLNNILALQEARALGADDCLILSIDDRVTEASNSNLWFVIGGRLVTPQADNLRGLTRISLYQACRLQDLQTFEEDVLLSSLSAATECFVTSSTREVMPVCRLRMPDGRQLSFPSGGGELTRKVMQLYKTFIESYVHQYAETALF